MDVGDADVVVTMTYVLYVRTAAASTIAVDAGLASGVPHACVARDAVLPSIHALVRRSPLCKPVCELTR